jgi:hypothetical protein
MSHWLTEAALDNLPTGLGTEGSQTLRWREMDSNYRYAAQKAVDFRSIPGIAEVSAGS